MNDLMLDIETLGTRPTSVICQLGACYFDRNTGKVGDKFLKNIEVGSALMAGLTIDQSTVDWWKQQDERTWHTGLIDIWSALHLFSDFCKDVKSVWSHATFDVPIVQNAYQVCDIKSPWHYRAAKDIRTLVDLTNPKFKTDKDLKTHNALDDCLYQVKYCVGCFNKLRKEIV